ncbi:MAG: glycine oxidase [Paracoccaceae bacterium]
MASDVAVIGGGAFGLWCARACAARGLSVVLLDAGAVARGGGAASMGLVGALAPHRPEPWTPVKAMQLAALLSLPHEVARLADETGLDPGWRPVGRIVPLHSAAARARAEEAATLSTARWAAETPPGAFAPFGRGAAPRMWLEDGASDPGWLAPPAFGVQRDDLSARIAPRAFLTALRAAVIAAGAEVREGARVASVSGRGAVLADGSRVDAGAVIVAAGAASFGLLAPHCGGEAPGWGVKGQAALFDVPAPPGAVAINDGGIWIIPQAGGIAVGSTSERHWTAPGPDALLDACLAEAATLCPLLRGHAPTERWAGLRPRAIGRRPMVGPVPGVPGLWTATGGFKIGFALAHAVAGPLAALICGEEGGGDALPDPFLPGAHLAERR